MPLPPTTVLLDIGGVLLSNGWDHAARRRASERFGLELEELESRHCATFSALEEGRLSLDQYLRRVVFFRQRSFSLDTFKNFLLQQSEPFPEMLALARALKARHGLRLVAVSNEGRELTQYRVEKFALRDFIDFFVCSCFIGRRKPDAEFYRMALDLTQASTAQVVYVDDRPLFVEAARELGLPSIPHTGYEATRQALAALGLPA